MTAASIAPTPTTVTTASAVTDAELFARFQPIFDDIAASALDREKDRRLPFDEIERLRAAGYGRVRLAVEDGGLGASIEQWAKLQIALGAADANIPQALRGHFGFTETKIHPEGVARETWLRRIADGALVGNAQSEAGSASFLNPGTTLRRGPDGWLLNGTKYYSTGSIYSDWIMVTGQSDEDGTLLTVAVDAGAAGVERLDDWDGFGQRLTGSGTTHFVDVPVDDADVEVGLGGTGETYLHAFFQLNHLVNLAGIARGAQRDIVDYTKAKTRHLGNPTYETPKQDPAIQGVVGEIAGLTTAAEVLALDAARGLDRVERLQRAGTAAPEDYDAATYGVYHVQATIIDLVLRQTSRIFEVGGSSAASGRYGLDRHWRNARTVSSHNPAVIRNQVSGDYLLNGTRPSVFPGQKD